MGLDITFEKAKRHRVEETEERLNEIKRSLKMETTHRKKSLIGSRMSMTS